MRQPQNGEGSPFPCRRRRWPWPLLGLIAIGIGLFAWQAWPRDPGEHSADAGFLRDMHNHHSQAVSMAVAIRDRTEDPALFNMTTEMMLYQSTEMGMMFGLLDAWDLSYTGEDAPMTWMGHPTEGLMPGMATQEEMESLSTLPVDEAEILFLNLMIRHHQGGVQMAEALLERGGPTRCGAWRTGSWSSRTRRSTP